MQVYKIERDEDIPRILRMQQQDNPLCCPFCQAEGEDRVEYALPEMFPDGSLAMIGSCHDCDETWTSYFEFTEFL